MTIPKKVKGVRFQKKVKKSNQSKLPSKRTNIVKDDYSSPKNWQKNIHIEFEDEFLNNSLLLNSILE